MIRRRGANDPATKFERGWDWRLVSQAFRRANPICQAIDDGNRCYAPAELVHHLISPNERPDLRIFWPNLVSLCANHHTPDEGDGKQYDYAPTTLPDGREYLHAPIASKPKLFSSPAPNTERVNELLADVLDADPDELLKLL